VMRRSTRDFLAGVLMAVVIISMIDLAAISLVSL